MDTSSFVLEIAQIAGGYADPPNCIIFGGIGEITMHIVYHNHDHTAEIIMLTLDHQVENHTCCH